MKGETFTSVIPDGRTAVRTNISINKAAYLSYSSLFPCLPKKSAFTGVCKPFPCPLPIKCINSSQFLKNHSWKHQFLKKKVFRFTTILSLERLMELFTFKVLCIWNDVSGIVKGESRKRGHFWQLFAGLEPILFLGTVSGERSELEILK